MVTSSIYVVTLSEYEDENVVVGVFSSRESALVAIGNSSKNYGIAEFVLDAPLAE